MPSHITPRRPARRGTALTLLYSITGLIPVRHAFGPVKDNFVFAPRS